ncbi:TaqI-like C-terminal specificity domain-containing protein [Deinococcus sp. VB142]|uniref:site-specific DNA-methyltransferase (adenine-specific) n=1 Tax=Deinococcus sp. VB142 TaxID=3112952 RepID=A0AAU6Q859_9DEIO
MEFGHLKVFDAFAFPTVVIFSKERPNTKKIFSISEREIRGKIDDTSLETIREALASFHEFIRTEGFFISKSSLTEEWAVERPEIQEIVHKMELRGKQLAQKLEASIYRGITTGFNDAYILNELEYNEIKAYEPQSLKYLFPLLRGRYVQRWTPAWDNSYILILENSFSEKTHSWSGHSESEAFEILLSGHPLIAKRLASHEKSLRKRTDRGYYWWELRPCKYYEAFRLPKIAWGKYGSSPRFYFDDQGFINLNTIYFFNTDKKWILPILNSSLSYFYSLLRFNVVKDGFIEYTSSSIGRFPIPTPTPEQARRLEGFTDDSRLSELNALVYELYGLNAGEIALVEELTAGAYGAASAEAEAEGEEE